MKRFIRVLSLTIVVCMLIAIPGFAVEQEQRASSFFSAYKAYCYHSSSNQIGIYFSVLGVGGMDEIGANVVKVQRSSDGTNWSTVKTFYKSTYSQMTGSNTGAHATTLYCTKTAGFYYRAYVEFYAKNSSGTGSLGYYTTRI